MNSWSLALTQIDEILGSTNNPVKPSQLALGFEQNLREIPLILADLPEQIRPSAVKVFYKVVGNHLPNFFEKNKTQLDHIVSKGQIRTENEWYLVRLRVDEIEGHSSSETELEVLYELLSKFEASV